ncbi:cytochrome P450 [Microdochium bolleyi]|uniref:Cytochrome P450 n=1 Tax=Microdochium bolleyi TaxID=196109 RepID=A0A136J435_9PEZI|nr:cytochrome P450 [Microdochium bolleyi]
MDLVREYLSFIQDAGPAKIAATVGVAWAGLQAIKTFRSWWRLRHFPGPRFASLSYLWGYRRMTTGQMHLKLAAEQEKHGKIVRIGPNELMVSDSETLWHINSVRSEYPRGAWYGSIQFDPYGHSVLSEPNTALHDKRKAKIMSGYYGKGRTDLEADVDTMVAELVNVIKTNYADKDKTLDFSLLIRFFQVDIVTLVGSGRPWGDLKHEKDNFDFISIADTFVPFLHAFMMIPTLRDFFASQFFLKLAGPKPTDANGMGRFLGIVKQTVAERFRGDHKNRQHGDMLDEWMKNGLTQRECELELAVQVPAGSETSTSAIRSIMLYVLSTARVHNKLKDEIAQGIREGRISSPITQAEARELPYLQAVIYEGIRMVPPAITGFPKQVPPGGDTLCGQFVPGGTDIFVNLWSMVRDKEVFGSDADVFRPERFIDCDEAQKARLVKQVDLAFGHGRWLCPGRTLAWLELNKVFVELLRQFDFQIENPQKPWHCRGYSSFMIDDFYLRVSMDERMPQ